MLPPPPLPLILSPLVGRRLSLLVSYLLADEVRESATDTADLAQSVHDLARAVHVGVQHTQQALATREQRTQQSQRQRTGQREQVEHSDHTEQHTARIVHASVTDLEISILHNQRLSNTQQRTDEATAREQLLECRRGVTASVARLLHASCMRPFLHRPCSLRRSPW